MKKCKRCNIEKEHIEFSLSKNSKDGLNSWCKKCKSDLDFLKNDYSDDIIDYLSNLEYYI